MKVVKRVSLAVGILVCLALVSSALYMFKMQLEKNKMSSMDTRELFEGIYTIENDDFVNLYILKNGDSYIAIDVGSNLKSTQADLEKLKIDSSKVAAVFLTHTDSDHTAALSAFENAKVYISAQEEQMINGKTVRASGFFKNSIASSCEKLEDNQLVDISGFKVKGILNPGHTPGSMSYLVNGRYLFVGDALSLKDRKAERFNEFFNMDTETAEKSIKILTRLNGIKYIFSAHYGYTDDFQAAMDKWK